MNGELDENFITSRFMFQRKQFGRYTECKDQDGKKFMTGRFVAGLGGFRELVKVMKGKEQTKFNTYYSFKDANKQPMGEICRRYVTRTQTEFRIIDSLGEVIATFSDSLMSSRTHMQSDFNVPIETQFKAKRIEEEYEERQMWKREKVKKKGVGRIDILGNDGKHCFSIKPAIFPNYRRKELFEINQYGESSGLNQFLICSTSLLIASIIWSPPSHS